VEGNDPHGGHGYVCEGDTARVGVRRVSHGVVGSIYHLSGGCLLSETLAYRIHTAGNYPKESMAKV